MNWSNDWAQCAVCTDVQTFALLSLYQYRGGILKRKWDIILGA